MSEARSVEIPDAAVEAGIAAFERVPEKQGAVDDTDGQFRDAMRAALVAARPYLLDRTALTAILRHKIQLQQDFPTFIAEAADETADAIMALLNGTES